MTTRVTVPRTTGDPFDDEFTLAGQSVLQQDDGQQFSGYRNYLGHEVIGAWRWDSEFNIGLITEMERAEALSPYYTARWLIVINLAVTIVLAIFSNPATDPVSAA